MIGGVGLCEGKEIESRFVKPGVTATAADSLWEADSVGIGGASTFTVTWCYGWFQEENPERPKEIPHNPTPSHMHARIRTDTDTNTKTHEKKGEKTNTKHPQPEQHTKAAPTNAPNWKLASERTRTD